MTSLVSSWLSIASKKKDTSVLTDHPVSREASPAADHMSKEHGKSQFKGLKLSGDKVLLKRILFLKDSLEKNPHLNKTEDIQTQFKSAIKFDPSELISPKDASMTKLIKVAEPPIRKNFFQTPSMNSLASTKKQSQSMIRKFYDSVKDQITYKAGEVSMEGGVFPTGNYTIAKQTVHGSDSKIFSQQYDDNEL